MEQSTKTKGTKTKPQNSPTVGLRLRRETKKRIQLELAKINKKDFGKKVRVDELFGLLFPMLNETHVKSLQEHSMTNSDRLELQYRDYVKKFGAISKDEFLGRLLGATAAASMPGI